MVMGLQVYDQFADAQAALSEGYVVAGTLQEDGKPVYFVVKADVSEDTMRELSFEVRNGKPMTEYQRTILEFAKAGVR